MSNLFQGMFLLLLKLKIRTCSLQPARNYKFQEQGYEDLQGNQSKAKFKVMHNQALNGYE